MQRGILSMKPMPGDVIDAKVTSVEHFGVFLEHGNIRLLVLITEMSRERVEHPSDPVRPGDAVRVQMARCNEVEDRYTARMLS